MSLPSNTDAKLWLALLYEVTEAGGSASPRDVIGKVQEHFPNVTDTDLALTTHAGESLFHNRIRWARQKLVERGCLLKEKGVWTITAMGTKWLKDTWKGSDADYTKVVKPPLVKIVPTPPQPEPEPGTETKSVGSGGDSIGVLEKPTPAPAPVVVITDPTERLCNRLRTTQRQSNASQNFELALTEAFAALGFESQHIGGSGETDIFITARLGQSTYTAVLDAKSTQNGKVPDAQINWLVIDGHRQNRGANYAAVIGESFSGGQLKKFADQHDITLLTTGMLCDVLTMHARTPFNLIELRDLFSVHGLADQAIQALRQRHAQHLRHWHLIAEIIDTMETFEAKIPGGAGYQTDQLHLVLMTQRVNKAQGQNQVADIPTPKEVADAVVYLSSRAVQILAEVAGTNGAYQLAMSGEMARQRILALGRSLAATPDLSPATATAPQPLLPFPGVSS